MFNPEIITEELFVWKLKQNKSYKQSQTSRNANGRESYTDYSYHLNLSFAMMLDVISLKAFFPLLDQKKAKQN